MKPFEGDRAGAAGQGLAGNGEGFLLNPQSKGEPLVLVQGRDGLVFWEVFRA